MSARAKRQALYDEIHAIAMDDGSIISAMRELCRNDLFYLLTRACNRHDIDKDWLFDRCLEVQLAPDEHLDLWAREHYKSTIITFAKTIQDILNNPEITVGIFSHTKPIAKAFLRQIKYELETNERLKQLFPEILWADPKKDAPAAGCQWSEDKGITVKRSTNPKEATVEANGLVDGQPTSKHYSLLVYDDVVTLESVSSPEMMKKTTDALALSYNLGAHGGCRRFIGTRYHYNDTYATLLDRKTATPRIHPATDDGKDTGNPVFLDRETLMKKRRDMGVYVYGCQMLQDPKADGVSGFKEEWLRYYGNRADDTVLNKIMLVDPANKKRKLNDYTTILVLGLGVDQNIYLLDGVRDRLNLTDRTDAVFELHRAWSPMFVGYEEYGLQADIEHIQYVQQQKTYHFPITPMGGKTAKEDRIRKLVPKFEFSRVYLPNRMPKRLSDGSIVDLVEVFIKEEYKPFPVMSHDDMLDCFARVCDEQVERYFPAPQTNYGRVSVPKVKRAIR